MRKRFLVGITSLALAAGAAFGLSQSVGSAAAATSPAATVGIVVEHGRGPNDGSHAGGQVSGVSGTTITVTGRDGTSKTIATTNTTTFELDGSASSLSAIAAGQFIRAEGTSDANGVFTATAVYASTTQPAGRPGEARQADGSHAGGQVSGVSGTTITVTGRDGTSKTIATTNTTTFELDGSASSLSAIAAGQFIRAEGTSDANGVFTATAVYASTTQPAGRPGEARQADGSHAGGQVSGVSGTTITVTGRDGTSKTIATTNTTTFELDGSASSLSAIAAGQFIRAEGTSDANGVFTATAVHASTTQPAGRPHR